MTNCPNCGAILPMNLASRGTVQCEYCGGFIEIGAIDADILYENTLYANDEPIVSEPGSCVNAMVKCGCSFKDLAKSIDVFNKAFSESCLTMNEARQMCGLATIPKDVEIITRKGEKYA